MMASKLDVKQISYYEEQLRIYSQDLPLLAFGKVSMLRFTNCISKTS